MSYCSKPMQTRTLSPVIPAGLAACLSLLLTVTVHAQPPAPTYIWLEGEAGVATNFDDKKINRAGWGHPEYLSGDKWLNLSVDEKDADSTIPAAGMILQYSLTAPKSGRYAVWNRV